MRALGIGAIHGGGRRGRCGRGCAAPAGRVDDQLEAGNGLAVFLLAVLVIGLGNGQQGVGVGTITTALAIEQRPDAGVIIARQFRERLARLAGAGARRRAPDFGLRRLLALRERRDLAHARVQRCGRLGPQQPRTVDQLALNPPRSLYSATKVTTRNPVRCTALNAARR